MEEPAMEMFTRSRNATALNTNSQKTRSQRVWLMALSQALMHLLQRRHSSGVGLE